MAEHSLKALPALGGATAALVTIGAITIRENPDLAMASLTARTGCEADLAKAAKKLMGLTLPGPGLMAKTDLWAAFWSGPNQWMVSTDFARHEDICAIVKAGVGATGSITEQTDGWVRLEVEGASSPALFERLCNVDIHSMKTLQAVRTQIEHLGCFILCHQTGQSFSVLTLRSAAKSMLHALETAARSL